MLPFIFQYLRTFIFIIPNFVYMFACRQVYVNAGTFRGQRHQISWSWELLALWTVVGHLTCILRTELWSSRKTASALNSSPSLQPYFPVLKQLLLFSLNTKDLIEHSAYAKTEPYICLPIGLIPETVQQVVFIQIKIHRVIEIE